MAKIAKILLIILLLILMPGFPTLPSQPIQGRRRISQRDVLPTATRRRHQLAEERAFTAIVAPTGKVGDFSDIQEAIDFTNKLGGGRILVMSGTYAINRNLILYDDISIEGLSQADTILDFGSSAYNLATDTAAKNIIIKSMSFKNSTDTNGAVYLDEPDNIFLERCTFDNNSNLDIKVNQGTSFRISNNVSTNIVGGFIYLNETEGPSSIEYNDVHSATEEIIETSTSDVILRLVIRENYFVSQKACIKGVFTGVFFTGNKMTTSHTSAIDSAVHLIAGDGVSSGACIFAGNSIAASGTTKHGVEIDGGIDDTKFLGNNISNAAANYSAIFLAQDVDRTTITGNSIQGNQYAINISHADCNNTTVVGNFVDGTTADVNDSGTNSIVEHNNTF